MDEKLLEILVCPISKMPFVKEGNYLVSTDKETRYRYKIEDDIIIFLEEKREQLSFEEWLSIMKKHNVRIE